MVGTTLLTRYDNIAQRQGIDLIRSVVFIHRNNRRPPHKTLPATAYSLNGRIAEELLHLLEDVSPTNCVHYARRSSCSFSPRREAVFGFSLHRTIDWAKRTELCPPLSPDLTPAGFCLWGHLKGIVYSKRVNTRGEVWRSIRAATTTRHMLRIFFSIPDIHGVTGLSYAFRRTESICGSFCKHFVSITFYHYEI
jgi:hypothetical protein